MSAAVMEEGPASLAGAITGRHASGHTLKQSEFQLCLKNSFETK